MNYSANKFLLADEEHPGVNFLTGPMILPDKYYGLSLHVLQKEELKKSLK